MKFELQSYYWKQLNVESWKDWISDSWIEEDKLYVEINDTSELEDILDQIPEDLYDDTGGWFPKELHVDFEWKVITLYDCYCE